MLFPIGVKKLGFPLLQKGEMQVLLTSLLLTLNELFTRRFLHRLSRI